MLERFINIFEGLDRAYGTFVKGKSTGIKAEGRSSTVREPLTKQLWQDHLDGKYPSIGVMPLKDDGTCKWGAIDIDLPEFDYEDLLKTIRKLKLPLIMFRSKSGCAHVYMFMKEFTNAAEVQKVMKKFAAKLGLADKLDRTYPLQTEIDPKDTGSYLNLPYFNHEEGSRYAWNDEFEAASVEEFFEMYEKYAQDNLGEYLVDEKIPKKKEKAQNLEDLYIPCMKNCLKRNDNKIPGDIGRNDYLLHCFTWAKRAEKHAKEIPEFSNFDAKDLLKYFNKKSMESPLPEDEIEKTIFKSENTEYKYLCKRPNIQKDCDPTACRFHICGINKDEAEQLVRAEELFGTITEYTSEPPVFFDVVKVIKDSTDNLKQVRVEFTGSEIIDKKLYCNKLSDAGYFPPNALYQMKSDDFRQWQLQRLTKRNIEEAEEETQKKYQFESLIYDFVEKATVSLEKHNIQWGTCYLDQKQKTLEFRIKDLMEYLASKNDKTSVRKICFDLAKIMDAKRNRGDYTDKVSKKRVSCVTWKFAADSSKFAITINQTATKQLKNDKN